MKSTYAAGVLLAALGGLWYMGGGPTPPALAAREDLRVSAPVGHDNLAVFFLRGPDKVDDSKVVPLADAIKEGWAVVHETGSVNELAVENRSDDRELYVPRDEIVKGGRQDRMIAADLLVPPKSGRVAVPAHCVEHNRWTNRGAEPAAYFASSGKQAVGNDIKLANATRNQGEVWAKVDQAQKALSANLGTTVNAAASPSSLQLALENDAVKAKVAAYEKALRRAGERADGVVGVVFVVNGDVRTAEVYGSAGLFRKAWPKLLAAAAEEAIATKPKADAPAVTTRDVEAFLASAAVAEPATDTNGAHAAASLGRQNVTLNLAGVNNYTGSTTVSTGTLTLSGVNHSTGTTRVGGGVLVLNDGESAGPTDQAANSPPIQSRSAAMRNAVMTVHAGNANPDGPSAPAVQHLFMETTAYAEAVGRPVPPPVQAAGNTVNVNTIGNATCLTVESRDAGRGNAVLRRSYIKK